MPDYKEKDIISQRPIYYHLKHKIGNDCHILVGVIAYEKKKMKPEMAEAAEYAVKEIMKAVEDTAGMKQPEEARWLVREDERPAKVN